MRPTRLLSAAASASALLLGYAGAAQAAELRINQHILDDAGNPQLVANVYPNGGIATAAWRICTPDCGPVVHTGAPFAPGDQAPGTTFEASATVDGTVLTARSRPWTGRVTSTALPTLSGTLRVGEPVVAEPGAWAGGWSDDWAERSLRACPTVDGASGCGRIPVDRTVIDSAYAGWYVGAVEQRYGREAVFPALAWPAPVPGQPSTLPVPAASRTTVYGALVGPIAPAPSTTPPSKTPPPSVLPSPPSPKVTLRKRASRDGRRWVLGTITCERCTARVVVSQKGRKDVVRTIRATGTTRILAPMTFSTRRKVSVRATFTGAPDVRAKGSVALR